MAGLSVRTGLGIRYSAPTTAAPVNTGTIDYAAFSPGSTTAPESNASALTPNTATSKAMWIGIVSLGLLAFIRWSLPR